MKRLLIIIALLSAPVWGQSLYTYLPVIPIVQSRSSAGTSIAWARDVTSGDLIIAMAQVFGATGSPTFSATHCSSWTQLQINNTNAVQTAVYGCFATSSGPDTISYTWSGSGFQGIVIGEFLPYWTLTQDILCSGTFAACTTTFVSSPPSYSSATGTTATNGDLLLSMVGGFNSAGSDFLTTAGWFQHGFVGGGGSSDSIFGAFSVAGAAGSTYSTTWANAGNSQGTIVILALAPNALSIVSPATAPDGALTKSYDWTLQALGGVGSYTWSVTGGSLQAGLSLNTSTGEITGTPTASSTNSITFHVTDGTHTANKTISLTVGASLNTITLVQSQTNTAPLASTIVLPNPVAAGDGLCVAAGSPGAFAILEQQYCTDTLGTNLKRVVLAVNGSPSFNSPNSTQLFCGVAPSSGSDTATCAFGPASFSEWSGVDYFAPDNVVITNGSGSFPATITSSPLTTLVPNQLLIGVAELYDNTPNMIVDSPFTSIGPTTFPGTTGYDIVTSVTGYTVSFAVTTGNTGPWQIGLAGFRPSATAPAATATRNRITVIQH